MVHEQPELDHIAIAVPPALGALEQWLETTGASHEGNGVRHDFVARQYRFGGGGKLEFLSPAPGAGEEHFVRRHLARRGVSVHHVTVKHATLASLAVTVGAVRDAGVAVADPDGSARWQESFVSPADADGVLIQLAWGSESESEWSERTGGAPRAVGPACPRLRGLGVPVRALAPALRLWTSLGADARRLPGGAVVSWPAGRLSIVLRETSAAAPPVMLWDRHGLEHAPDDAGDTEWAAFLRDAGELSSVRTVEQPEALWTMPDAVRVTARQPEEGDER